MEGLVRGRGSQTGVDGSKESGTGGNTAKRREGQGGGKKGQRPGAWKETGGTAAAEERAYWENDLMRDEVMCNSGAIGVRRYTRPKKKRLGRAGAAKRRKVARAPGPGEKWGKVTGERARGVWQEGDRAGEAGTKRRM